MVLPGAWKYARFLEFNVAHCKYYFSTGRLSSTESYRCLKVKANLSLCMARRHTEGAARSFLTSALDGSDINTVAASYLNTQGRNNSCLKSPASTLVDLTFQSRSPLFQLKSAM